LLRGLEDVLVGSDEFVLDDRVACLALGRGEEGDAPACDEAAYAHRGVAAAGDANAVFFER